MHHSEAKKSPGTPDPKPFAIGDGDSPPQSPPHRNPKRLDTRASGARRLAYPTLKTLHHLCRTCGPNSLDLNLVNYAIWGPEGASLPRHGKKFDNVDHLQQARAITAFHRASVNVDVVCSVSRIRIADTLSTRFTNSLPVMWSETVGLRTRPV